MTPITTQHSIYAALTLFSPEGDQLVVQAVELALTHEAQRCQGCQLTIQVSPSVLQEIETQGYFHLTPAVRGPIFGGDFDSAKDVEIDLALDKALWSQMDGSEEERLAAAAAKRLVQLSQQGKPAPLLMTDRWYGLHVKQEISLPKDLGKGTLKVGYRTEWSNKMNKNEGPLLTILSGYLIEDGWPVEIDEDMGSVQTRYRGSNGEWTCFTVANEEQQQIIFYSIAPMQAPEARRTDLAIFLTLANYGLPLGNFEMDWRDGEIRFKTGIDVEGDDLTPALLRHVVEANVINMDMYLPGIEKLLDGQMTPFEAIEAVENQE